MNNSALPYWLTFAVFLVAAYGGFKWYQVEQSRQLGDFVKPNLPPLEEFELTERSGAPFRSADMKGKVWVVTFFFSTCPGSCKRLNDHIKYLTSLEEIRDVTWVSITVDPENDTLPVLRQYADARNADPQRWLFCRGEFDYVKRLAHDVLRVGGVSYKDHNDYAVIVDKRGEIASMFNASSNKASLEGIETMKKCLDDEVPAPAIARPAAAELPKAEAASGAGRPLSIS